MKLIKNINKENMHAKKMKSINNRGSVKEDDISYCYMEI